MDPDAAYVEVSMCEQGKVEKKKISDAEVQRYGPVRAKWLCDCVSRGQRCDPYCCGSSSSRFNVKPLCRLAHTDYLYNARVEDEDFL